MKLLERPAEITTLTEKKEKSWRAILVSVLAIGVTLFACVVVLYYWSYITSIGNYGYVGLFIISVLAGGTVVVPVPGLLLVFTLGSFLNPLVVGAIAGFGEAIGGVSIYLAGYGGKHIFKNTNHGMYTRMSGWLQKRGSLAVFINSAVFNPLFYPFSAIAGMLRFGLYRFFLLSWAGKTVKDVFVAYMGFLGLRSLLHAMGIPV